MSETFHPLATDRDVMQVKRPGLGGELEIGLPAERGCLKGWVMGLFFPQGSCCSRCFGDTWGCAETGAQRDTGKYIEAVGPGQLRGMGPGRGTVSTLEVAHLLRGCSHSGHRSPSG